MHIWERKTMKEKRDAQQEIDSIKKRKKSAAKAEWELETSIRRMYLQQRPGGRPPQWKFTVAQGALV